MANLSLNISFKLLFESALSLSNVFTSLMSLWKVMTLVNGHQFPWQHWIILPYWHPIKEHISRHRRASVIDCRLYLRLGYCQFPYFGLGRLWRPFARLPWYSTDIFSSSLLVFTFGLIMLNNFLYLSQQSSVFRPF